MITLAGRRTYSWTQRFHLRKSSSSSPTSSSWTF